MQNTAAALDFQYTSRYNKVYFDPEGGIFLNRMLGYLKGYERESVLAPLFKMLEATFDLFVPLVMADIVKTYSQQRHEGNYLHRTELSFQGEFSLYRFLNHR